MTIISSLAQGISALAVNDTRSDPSSGPAMSPLSSSSEPNTSTRQTTSAPSTTTTTTTISTSMPIAPEDSHDSHEPQTHDSNDSRDPLAILGTDVFHLVLGHLTVPELLVAEAVSRSWRAFSLGNSPLWTAQGRRLGVHIPEWERTVRERVQKKRETVAELDEAVAQVDRLRDRLRAAAVKDGLVAEFDRLVALRDQLVGMRDRLVQVAEEESPAEAEMGAAAETDEMETVEETRGKAEGAAVSTLAPAPAPDASRFGTGMAGLYRKATIAHVELQNAWKDRHLYETLIPTPAFKLRHIALDPGEDTIYALTESASEDTDKLLVLDRYTGELLLTVPWITRGASISVGAGYVVVASVPGVDHSEEAEWGIEPDRVGDLHIYRTANAAARAVQVAKQRGVPPPPEFKADRGLPLEFFKTMSALKDCRAFRVKLDTRARTPQAVLAGVTEGKITLVYLEEGCREEVTETVKVETIDTSTLGRENVRTPPVYLQDVNFDDEFIYVATQYQVHVFERATRAKVIAFPDPYAEGAKHAAVAYRVPFNFPFHMRHKDPRPTLPPHAPDGVRLALTLQASISAWRSDTQRHQFHAVMDTEANFGDGEWTPDDALDSYLRSVTVTEHDMVLRNEHGKAIIVRNHRQVFNAALDANPAERVSIIAQHTAILSLNEPIEDLHVWRNRLFMHSAGMTIMCFDMDQLPSFPLADALPVPPAKAFVLEISCLENMQERSSFAVDARGVYLADWDAGNPNLQPDYEVLHNEHVESETWPRAIRPNWGCIKIWTARPESTLLTRPYPRLLARAMEDGIITVLPDDASGSDTTDSDLASDADSDTDSDSSSSSMLADDNSEETEPMNDDDIADAIGGLFGVDVVDGEEEVDMEAGSGDVDVDMEEEGGGARGDGAGGHGDADQDGAAATNTDTTNTTTTMTMTDTVHDSDEGDPDDDFYQSLFNPNYPNPPPSSTH